MEFTAYEHGVPCWVDVSSPDADKSVDFYSQLFDWDVPEGTDEFGGYRNAHINGKPVAGITPQMGPDAPPAWTTYIKVDDAAAVETKIAPAGGMVLAPTMAVGDLGKMAIFVDPAGAVFGVWEPGEHIGAELANEANTFCWNELISTDLGAATAFYTEVFGWGAQGSENDGSYTEWQVGGRSVGGGMAKPPSMPAEVPSYWNVYFAVDDLDASIAKAQQLGAVVPHPPMDTPVGKFATIVEPTGAVFSIIALEGEPG